MSQEARILWANKKCPFGVGDSNGKCCTTECGAWKEWNTRKSTPNYEQVWHYSKPGWFSEWKVIAKEVIGGFYQEDGTSYEHGACKFWVPETTKYLWERISGYNNTGSAGGCCGRLPK